MDTTDSFKLPPKNYRRTIEELSVAIPDPVLKLKFLKQAINEYQKISSQSNLKPPIAEITFQKKLLDNAEELWPGSKKAAENLIRKDVITTPDIKSRWVYKLRFAIGSAILIVFILGVGTAISPLVRNLNLGARISTNNQQAKPPNTKIIIRKPVFYSRPSNGGNNPPLSTVKSVNSQNRPELVLKYFQNPMLLALAPQKAIKTKSDRIAQKPLISSQTPKGDNHSPSSIIKIAKYQNGPEPVLKYFQNPILLALSSRENENYKADHLADSPLLASPRIDNKKHSPSASATSINFQNEIGHSLKFLKNPILLALSSLKNKNSNPDRFADLPLVTSPSLDRKKYSPSVIVTPLNFLNEIGHSFKFLQNPILQALSSQKYKNSKPDRFADLPFLTSPSSDNEKYSSSASVTPLNFQNEIGHSLKFLQNPILLALSSPKNKNSNPDRFADLPLVASLRLDSRNHTPAVTVKPENFQNKTGRVLKFLQNPIWLALLSQKTINTKSDRITGKPLLSSLPLNSDEHSSSAIAKPVKHQIEPVQVPEYLEDPIWLVEKTSDREIYSNRLQIITTHTISNLPRKYYRFPKNSNLLSANSKISDKISGILFHASESDLYPFMPEMNRSILKYSKQLIKYLLRKKSYHFFIDRFGRVYRLVQEDHAAFHAGNSIWADNEEIYLNLNHAFIGICFEGKDFEEIILRTQKKGGTKNSKSTLLKPTGISSFNEAQLLSGKELTDWLRVKYKISQHNCVPHALTSVNPDKMLIGFHLDLSRGFPFTEFGLTDKYQEPLPSIVEFGFLYDDYFEKIFNGELWRGIRYSQEILQRQAANSGMSVAEYRKGLHRRFSRLVDWKKEMHEKRAHLANNHQKIIGTKTP
jgi:hypothetical protein